MGACVGGFRSFCAPPALGEEEEEEEEECLLARIGGEGDLFATGG